MKLMISEILEQANKLKNREDKIAFLQQHDSIALRRILAAVYDPRCVFLLPDKDPPYHQSHHSWGHEKLYSESRKLYHFMDGGNPNLSQAKRETMFVEFLESIHPYDASMMLKIRKKRMPYATITETIIRTAFPDLLPMENKETEENTDVQKP